MIDAHATVASSSVEARSRLQGAVPHKKDADYVFYELTRSICPREACRRVIEAHILLRDNKVFMRSVVSSILLAWS